MRKRISKEVYIFLALFFSSPILVLFFVKNFKLGSINIVGLVLLLLLFVFVTFLPLLIAKNKSDRDGEQLLNSMGILTERMSFPSFGLFSFKYRNREILFKRGLIIKTKAWFGQRTAFKVITGKKIIVYPEYHSLNIRFKFPYSGTKEDMKAVLDEACDLADYYEKEPAAVKKLCLKSWRDCLLISGSMFLAMYLIYKFFQNYR